MKNSFTWAWFLIFALIVLVGISAYFLGRNSKAVTIENIATNTSVIKQIAELATLEVQGTASIKSSNIKNDGTFTDNMRKMFMENTIDISVPYIGKYGVNLQTQAINVQENNKKIIISLPQPILLSYEILMNKVSSTSYVGLLQPENNQHFSKVEQKLYEQSRRQLANNTTYIEQSKRKIAGILQNYYQPTGYAVEIYFNNEKYSLHQNLEQ